MNTTGGFWQIYKHLLLENSILVYRLLGIHLELW